MSVAFARWLSRRSRVSRPLRAATAMVLAAAAVVGLAAPGRSGALAPPSKLPAAPGLGDPTLPVARSPALLAEGYDLYENGCSSCHGLSLQGRPGIAPSLIGVGPGPVDFYLSTGRMPLAAPRSEPERAPPAYSPAQIRALVAYVASFGGPPAPTADPARGELALGLHDFTLNCAGCHQILARGGLTLGARVPNLQQANVQQIAEAIRMGPYLMPHFDAKLINQHALDSIARYVLWTRRPADKGGWGIYNIGPIPEGIVAWFLALAALLIVARLIGERTA